MNFDNRPHARNLFRGVTNDLSAAEQFVFAIRLLRAVRFQTGSNFLWKQTTRALTVIGENSLADVKTGGKWFSMWEARRRLERT